jgi:hypothetical protein
VNENYSGALQSFTVSKDGQLSLVSTAQSGGSTPAHLLALSTGQVAVMNVGKVAELKSDLLAN